MVSEYATPLRAKLRWVLAEHSLKDIHTELLSIMEEEYSFLASVFSAAPAAPVPAAPVPAAPVPAAPVPAAAQPATQSIEEISTGLPKFRSDTKIKIVKKASDVTPAPAPAPSPAPAPAQDVANPPSQAQMYDPKDLKKWQKGQENAKHAQLVASGIQPESLLTVDSMRTWIQNEGRTYAYVAREHVGLPEAVVAAFAKKHAITSTITKKRAILASRKPRA